MRQSFPYGCQPKFDDRWCNWHGTCTCTLLVGGSRIWDRKGGNDRCPLHGARSSHPLEHTALVKVKR